ncbi:hypothetical protein [Ciceribacter selenitireducens]|uniref:Uncharacterized protein n=1 Tax=Ciceribacter selenitireducens ATCC BAA-1503 TaxID=1336235 RepID=A0A376A9Z5_9HYPH|nr:hypothetical protein [Ciceribacter selenitireducens]SSC64490.1 unnamed protein product [Ciceribacter selenitireducens ATCC BAA-1503]
MLFLDTHAEPFGRGITLQIATDDLPHEDLRKLDWPLFEGPSEIWYRIGETEVAGSRGFPRTGP